MERGVPNQSPATGGPAPSRPAMPNFHPQLVALVAPLLEPGEEVWAVYPARRRSLVATGSRLFLVSPGATIAHPLADFVQMRRPRPSLVLLQLRAGGSMRIALDPSDEHGIQALTVIGLLLAGVSRAHRPVLGGPEPARAAPTVRHLLPTRRCTVRSAGQQGIPVNRSWSTGWADSSAWLVAHRSRFARHRYRLGMASPIQPVAAPASLLSESNSS